MKYDDEQIMQQLREMRYPGQADLVDAVMERVRLQVVPKQRKSRWRPYAVAAAASLLVAVSVSVVSFLSRDYNEPQICDMIAAVYDYQYDNQTIESYVEMADMGYYTDEE